MQQYTSGGRVTYIEKEKEDELVPKMNLPHHFLIICINTVFIKKIMLSSIYNVHIYKNAVLNYFPLTQT